MLETHSSATATDRAGLDARAGLTAATRAGAARVGALVAHLFAGAERRLFEAQRKRHANVAALAATKAERPQDVAEDFVEAAKVDHLAARAAAARLKRRRSVAIVGAALVRVGQDLMSQVDLREAVLRRRVALVLVGVVLGGEPAEGYPDIRFARVAANT